MPETRKDHTSVITLESNVLKNTEYVALRTAGFTRGPTMHADWLGLVNHAWCMSRLPPLPDVKDYLVLMLERNMRAKEILEWQIGLMFYGHVATRSYLPPALRQQLADITLLIVSLFPERIQYRHLPIQRSHLIDIGRTLYHSQWRNTRDEVFGELAERYMHVVMVLSHLRPRFARPAHARQQAAHGAAHLPNLTDLKEMARSASEFNALVLGTT